MSLQSPKLEMLSFGTRHFELRKIAKDKIHKLKNSLIRSRKTNHETTCALRATVVRWHLKILDRRLTVSSIFPTLIDTSNAGFVLFEFVLHILLRLGFLRKLRKVSFLSH